MSAQDQDIIDEAIHMYRANVLFKNFKILGPADKLIVYMTCFIQKCLQDIGKKPDQASAEKIVQDLCAQAVPTSGDDQFFMRKLGLLTKSKNNVEEEKFRKYLAGLKAECGQRLLHTLYNPQTGPLDCKYWLGLGKKPFLGQKFSGI